LTDENGTQSQVKTTVQVDMETTRNVLRTANNIRDIGSTTLVAMKEQAETIDRIENDVESIHHNLEQSDKLLKGIESVPYSIRNAFSKDQPSFERKFVDRTLEVKKEYPPADYDILEKQPNDHLEPAILRFTEDKFMILNPKTKKTRKKLFVEL